MGKQEDIWYAVNITRVIHAPQQTIETFGATTIQYHLVSELMDQINKVRVRAGSVYSERPQIITPNHFISQMLEGFGAKAQEYAEWLMSSGDMVRILRYGLHFRRDNVVEELISDSAENVAKKIKSKVSSQNNGFSAVVIGADELWEVSLLKFFIDFLQHSAPYNMEDLANPGQKNLARADLADIRSEIDADFKSASTDRGQIDQLAKKLQKSGLFEEYEDRFYSLIKSLR